jgi:hydroxyacylglutathione hydrolase
VLDQHRPILLIAEPGSETEAALRLGRIGFDQIRGFLDGGMEALAGRPDLLAETRRLSVEEIQPEVNTADGNNLLDVRTPGEWATVHIAGSVNIPLSRLRERLDEMPRDRRVYLHCAGGYRSSIAASLLAQHGFAEVTEMAGGLAAWQAAGLPVIAENEFSSQR